MLDDDDDNDDDDDDDDDDDASMSGIESGVTASADNWLLLLLPLLLE